MTLFTKQFRAGKGMAFLSSLSRFMNFVYKKPFYTSKVVTDAIKWGRNSVI